MGRHMKVSGDLDRWRRGMRSLPTSLPDHAARRWAVETTRFYSNTQAMVHVITGELKASGSHSTRRVGSSVVGEVFYAADYAIYEHGRGGSHAFITRAYQASAGGYRDALLAAWDDEVESWN